MGTVPKKENGDGSKKKEKKNGDGSNLQARKIKKRGEKMGTVPICRRGK